MKINFSSKKQDCQFKMDIERLYEIAIQEVGAPNEIVINIVDVSPDEIRRMNNEHRGVDRVTDVLSFPMIEDIKKIEDEPDFGLGECNIGDIYINPERAREQAEEYGHSYRREYCFLALHGLLHLLGYDHMTDEQEKEMFGLQEIILRKANIGRD